MSDGNFGDRLKGAMQKFLASVNSRIDYLAAYPCTVVKQNADGTLELKADNPKIEVPSHVPIRYGMPGVAVTVANGARVYLEFDDCDPSKPVAKLWEVRGMLRLFLGGQDVTGSDVSDFVAMASKVDARLESIRAAVSGHGHTCTGGTVGPMGTISPFVTVGSTIVGVK